MTTKQEESLFKVVQEINSDEVPRNTKLKSLIESGVGAIDSLLKMKNGCLTSIKLALDGDNCGDCIYTFRLLTSQEEYDIFDKLAATGLSYLDLRYKIKYAALTLSAASRLTPTLNEEEPQLSVKALMWIPKYMLLDLAQRYDEFVQKYSPKLEHLTQQDMDDCIKMIQECEDDVKKYVLLNGWSLKVTQDLLISSTKQLEKLTKQVEAVCIGS